VIDTETNPRSSSLRKIVEPEDIRRKTGLASSHCLASGDIMISFLGDKDGNAAGSGFFLIQNSMSKEGTYLYTRLRNTRIHI
jgi:selenium-binding protein 1